VSGLALQLSPQQQPSQAASQEVMLLLVLLLLVGGGVGRSQTTCAGLGNSKAASPCSLSAVAAAISVSG
jgi:hypothetical protein